MIVTSGLLFVIVVGGIVAAGCSSEGGDDAAPGSSAAPVTRACGDLDECDSTEFCIETQGAVCMPLPPPGGSCQEGCVLTEHCCNCSAFACVAAPEPGCGDGPSCGCLDTIESFLTECAPPRRECEERSAGVDVLCINVALDEDPFADAGSPP